MVLLIAIGVAAAAYTSKSPSSDNDAQFNLDLDGLTAVDLLPVERTLAIFESPITTITHMEGDPKEAADYLRKRVDDIVCQNPWLGGWLAKDKRDGAVKLFFDLSGEKLAPNLFRSFEPLEIPLSRDTPPVLQREILEKAAPDVKVKRNAEVIGRNEGLWRVSLIPDSDMPTERFALVVSQSHMLGDGHTFFAVYNMLNNNSPIVSLNPKRNFKWIKDVEETMGNAETYYLNKIAKSPLWARFQKDETVIETRTFFLNEEWVQGQKEAWEAVAAAEVAVENSETSSSRFGPARPDYAVSFASPLSAMSITTNDIVTCWFYRLVDATVGLMAYNFRGRLASCGNDDAGCYSCAIPYTAEDYETPTLIQQSRTSARRAHADRQENPTTLPVHSITSTYAVSNDWRSFQKMGGLDLGLAGTRQTLHMPLHDLGDIEKLPKSFSSITLFNAGPHGEPAVAVIAPQSVMSKIESSGIVKEMLFQSEGPSKDLFLENIQETAKGRRTSVYAQYAE